MSPKAKKRYTSNELIKMIYKGGLAHCRAKDYLIQTYSSGFYHEMRFLIRSDEFEDLLIESLNSLAENIQSQQVEIKNPAAYLKRILKNKVNKYLDKKTKERNSTQMALETENIVTEAEKEVSDANLRLIFKVLKDMPEHCRNLIMMKYYDGLSHKEIAERMNITVESSKVELSRCKRQLLNRITKKMEK
jgi:RNA polymerase sigma-70 factor (ECF subfamily)